MPGRPFEEPWDDFAASQPVYIWEIGTELPAHVVLARARSWIGRRAWDLLQNCDHHVRHALGHEVTSPQLRGAFALIGGSLLVWHARRQSTVA